jgi:hypothetical protein
MAIRCAWKQTNVPNSLVRRYYGRDFGNNVQATEQIPGRGFLLYTDTPQLKQLKFMQLQSKAI